MEFLAFLKSFILHIGLGITAVLSLAGIGDSPIQKELLVLEEKTAATEVTPLTPGWAIAGETPIPAIPTPLKPVISPFPKIDETGKAEAPPSPLPETPKPAEPVAENTPVSLLPPPTETAVFDLNSRVRQSIVNILCRSGGGGVPSASGSGIIIDSKGVILTNAHVAQLFLLRDYPQQGSVQCYIRTGSPARNAYVAELLFISPNWIRENARNLTQNNPAGTGEHDYALLRITGSANASLALPSSFPALSFDASADTTIGRSVLLAGYPAGFLDGPTIESNLYAVSSPVTIKNVYTFGTNTVDLLSVGGSLVAQKGSSGGGVVDLTTGKVVGVFVTSTEAATTGERDLRAITIEYIQRALLEEHRNSLETLLEGDIAAKAEQFNLGVAPTLTKLLTNALENR